MNLLMMTLLYPEDLQEEVARNAKDKLQNQINNYQHAFINGIQHHMQGNESLSILNSLPVGTFPKQYRQLFLRRGKYDGGAIEQIGCINLPLFKQLGRKYGAIRALKRWIKADRQNRTLLLYTQYLPYIKAVKHIKRKYPEVKAAVIVTDLPNEFGLASGRKGILKRIEGYLGKESVQLCSQMDGFVLLTEQMADVLQIKEKPYVVIEGLIQQTAKYTVLLEEEKPEKRPAVLYTGTLEPSLGIGSMLEAFAKIPECELWICGQGSMQAEVEKQAKAHPNIQYFGFVSQKEALALQAKATALINPRTPEGLFTKYSFPSKTLEYLRSGKPVLCYRLEGIPDDYDSYLLYFDEVGAEGISRKVKALLHMSEAERSAIGQRGKDYVLREKNPEKQCERLISLLRRL